MTRLESERLIGRPIEGADVEHLATLLRATEPAVSVGSVRRPAESIGEAARRWLGQFERLGFGLWLFFERTGGAAVGVSGLRQRERGAAGQVELVLARRQSSAGAAHEAEMATATIEASRRWLALDHLVAAPDRGNDSARGALGTLGFRPDSELAGRWLRLDLDRRAPLEPPLPPSVHEIDWRRWTGREPATLVFVIEGDKVLLIRKKRGLGAGKINGPGGRLEAGENPFDAAVRETEEELHITPTGLRYRGDNRFQFLDGYSIHVHTYVADGYRGQPIETDEATPLWTPLDAIPYDEMWEDDRLWLPLAFSGRRFSGRYLFDGERMIDHEILTWESR